MPSSRSSSACMISRILVMTSGNTCGEAMQVMRMRTISLLFARIGMVSSAAKFESVEDRRYFVRCNMMYNMYDV